ncbi:MAG: hypothetical protein GY719_10250 [bacterium]|nr:hypothetical protein [bacterium]
MSSSVSQRPFAVLDSARKPRRAPRRQGCAAGTAGAQPFAYITNNGTDTVSVVDTATNAVVDTVSVGTR